MITRLWTPSLFLPLIRSFHSFRLHIGAQAEPAASATRRRSQSTGNQRRPDMGG